MPQPYDPFREYLAGEMAHFAEEEFDEADGIAVGVTIDPERMEPVLLLSFFAKEEHVRTVKLVGHHPNLPQLVTDAINSYERVTRETAERLVAAFTERLQAGQVEIHEGQMEMVRKRGKIECPGCGRRLYGEIARRGGCMSCYPELPPGGKPL